MDHTELPYGFDPIAIVDYTGLQCGMSTPPLIPYVDHLGFSDLHRELKVESHSEKMIRWPFDFN